MSEYILSFDPGTINMAYCIVEIKTLKIIDWGLFSIKDSTKEGMCVKLIKQLDTLNLTRYNNTTIVIENQPGINKITNNIFGFLLMYYSIEKLTDPKIKKIVGYSPKNKNKYYVPREGDEPLPERLNKIKKGHYRNKQIAIEHCRRILIHNNESQEWIDFFENSSKKDDKSDVYLTICAYIHTYKLNISEECEESV